MNVNFVKVQEVFAHAAERHNTVMLDGNVYWVKRDAAYKCWDLDGRKCPSTYVYDEDLEDGSFYTRFTDLEYYG